MKENLRIISVFLITIFPVQLQNQRLDDLELIFTKLASRITTEIFKEEELIRSYFYGTTPLLLNAMLLGPGMGTNIGVNW